MPAPTDLLNDDVKELKVEIRDVRSNLDVLKADVHRIDVGVAELRAEFRFAKWLIGIMLAMTISGIGGGIWQMATLSADLKNLGVKVDRLSNQVDQIHRIDTNYVAPRRNPEGESNVAPELIPRPKP